MFARTRYIPIFSFILGPRSVYWLQRPPSYNLWVNRLRIYRCQFRRKRLHPLKRQKSNGRKGIVHCGWGFAQSSPKDIWKINSWKFDLSLHKTFNDEDGSGTISMNLFITRLSVPTLHSRIYLKQLALFSIFFPLFPVQNYAVSRENWFDDRHLHRHRNWRRIYNHIIIYTV